jgi:hypothetical protein
MFDLRGDVVDYRYRCDDGECPRAVATPRALWILVAVIGVVLGGAALAAAFSTDTRDFAARHQSVLPARVI